MDEQLQTDVPRLTVYKNPAEKATPINELLYGEDLQLLKKNDDEWAKIKSLHDDYEGWVQVSALTKPRPKTHKVFALASNLYALPDFKTAPVQTLYFLSTVNITDKHENGFVCLANGFWIFERDLVPLDHFEPDFVKTALKFLNTPYVWGGRSAHGIDCSGLIQVSLMAAGYNLNRDSGDQMMSAGVETSVLKPGTLIFYKGHVAIYLRDDKVLNATSRIMSAQIESMESLGQYYGAPVVLRDVMAQVQGA